MEKLSAELLTSVFEHLENRRDIANSRLVSQTFKSSSSRFLIPRVTIAKRLGSLRLFRDIIHHPELSQYVTELIWDASVYRHFSPPDFDDYVQACRDSGREFKDVETVQEDRDFTAFCHGPGASSSPLLPETESLSLPAGVHLNNDIMLTTGMRRGYAKHFKGWAHQRRIQLDGLHLAMLQLALQRLPMLRKIVFTDFRGLTRPGERYDQLCARLFGNTLEPYGLDDITESICAEFNAFKSIITQVANSITVIVCVHFHRCGSLQHQYQGPLLRCCEPRSVRVAG